MTEVTRGQFLRFLKSKPGYDESSDESNPDLPKNHVSWYQATEYCNWLSEQEGIPSGERCYLSDEDFSDGITLPADFLKRTGYRLPTEAEWEYACRAGTLTSRHFGETEALLGHYAWYAKNELSTVASLKPNDWGLFDMHGNVYEWCHDRYTVPGGDLVEDEMEQAVVTTRDGRVLRSGSFQNIAPRIRSAFRLKHSPDHRKDNVGFRIARTER